MTMDILRVKNMVCHRCILSVEDILNKSAIPFDKVLFGEIYLKNEISREQKENLSANLKNEGFEVIDTRLNGLIEKIKMLVIKRVRNEVDKKESKPNLSTYLSEELHYEYTHLSSLFSEVEGRTIENFFIEQRIEKAITLCKFIKQFFVAKENPNSLTDKDHYANKRVRKLKIIFIHSDV